MIAENQALPKHCKTAMKTIGQENGRKLIVTCLNIKSVRIKFGLLCDQINGIIDILMIPETKIDDSFPLGNFLMDGSSTPYNPTMMLMEVKLCYM